MNQTANPTITSARVAESNLVVQINSVADALAGIATTSVEAAVQRVRVEAAALVERVEDARAVMAAELLSVLDCLTGLADDMEAGLALPEAPALPALPAQALPAPKASTGEQPSAPAGEANAEQSDGDQPATAEQVASPTPAAELSAGLPSAEKPTAEDKPDLAPPANAAAPQERQGDEAPAPEAASNGGEVLTSEGPPAPVAPADRAPLMASAAQETAPAEVRKVKVDEYRQLIDELGEALAEARVCPDGEALGCWQRVRDARKALASAECKRASKADRQRAADLTKEVIEPSKAGLGSPATSSN